MPDQLQLRGGTTTEHNSFTGALREVTVDTTKKTLVVHDGSQAGGTPLMKESGATAASSIVLGTGGVERLKLEAAGVVFNETGADVDFRIEGDTNANLFKVDAGNDRIGIGVASPSQTLEVAGNIGINANLIHNGDTDTMLSFSADNQIDIQCASTLIGRFTTNGLATGNGKRIDYLSSNGERSGVIANSDSSANALVISADPDNSRSGTFMHFLTDGSERMRIHASGQLAIGRTDPKEWHSTYKSIQLVDAGTFYANSNDSFVAVGANHYLNTSGNFIYDKTDFATRLYQIDGGFHFETAASGTAGSTLTFTEVMKLDSAGNLTIGTDGASGSGPSVGYDELCIEGGNEDIGMCFLSPAANTVKQRIAFGDSNNNKSGEIRYDHANDDFEFYTAGSERMRVDSSGKVHIGLTNGAGQFNVKNQNDSATNAFEVYNDNGIRNAAFSQSSEGDGTLDLRTNGTAQNVLLRSNGASHLSGGNVGINVATPSNRLHVKDGNPYIEIEGTANSGDAGIFFNAKANHWNLRADNSNSQNAFGLKSGTPASSTHTVLIASQTIDLFQQRNIYERHGSPTITVANNANKQFTITGLGYGWAKLQLAFYGEGHQCAVEVFLGGLMASGGTFYSATVIANTSSSQVDVNFGTNQTSYVVTISNNVSNGGSIHGTALFTGQGGSAHPSLAVS